ncbi:MAG: Cys-tRNA(Pro) deacylase [Bacteroidota bacterium]
MKKTNVERILDNATIEYTAIKYTYHIEDLNLMKIAADNKLDPGVIFKTLVTQDSNKRYFVAVLPGDKTLDFKKLAQQTGSKKIQMLSPKLLSATTGYVRGGCSPIGMKKKFPTYIDESALELDQFYINAGKRGVLIGFKPEMIKKIIDCKFCNLAV